MFGSEITIEKMGNKSRVKQTNDFLGIIQTKASCLETIEDNTRSDRTILI